MERDYEQVTYGYSLILFARMAEMYWLAKNLAKHNSYFSLTDLPPRNWSAR
jgi:hypothetical protein